MLAYQLTIVFIRRHHVHIESLFFGLLGNGTYHIVGFVTGYFQYGYIVRLNNLLDNRNGCPDYFGRFFPLGLVLFECFVTECGARRIESYGDMGWAFPF